MRFGRYAFSKKVRGDTIGGAISSGIGYYLGTVAARLIDNKDPEMNWARISRQTLIDVLTNPIDLVLNMFFGGIAGALDFWATDHVSIKNWDNFLNVKEGLEWFISILQKGAFHFAISQVVWSIGNTLSAFVGLSFHRDWAESISDWAVGLFAAILSASTSSLPQALNIDLPIPFLGINIKAGILVGTLVNTTVITTATLADNRV